MEEDNIIHLDDYRKEEYVEVSILCMEELYENLRKHLMDKSKPKLTIVKETK